MTLPDPQELIDRLAEQVRPHVGANTALLGIHTGGVWVMEALAERLGGDLPTGVLDITFYRDDFSRIGLHPEVRPSSIPFDIEGRDILLVDDVLYTGRTVRAAMNLVFDYGRPASLGLVVLVDRGGRELPVCAQFVGATLDLGRHLSLVREADGNLKLVAKEEAA